MGSRINMRRVGGLIAGVVYAVCLLVRCFQTQFCHPIAQWLMDAVLSSWEESITTAIRELFSTATIVINNIFSWVVSAVVGRPDRRDTVKASSNQTRAWQSWWSAEHTSTFNAIVANERDLRTGATQSREKRRERNSDGA